MASTVRNQIRGMKIRNVILAAALAQFAGTTWAFGQSGSPAMPPSIPPASGSPSQMTPKRESDPKGKVAVDEHELVDLAVNDEDLGTVLEMLSIQSKRNIIASKNVNARVTANLYKVSFFDALDAILGVNGYGYIENGSFVMVYTAEELKVMEASMRKRVSKVIGLNYLNATDAAEFVKPLLSVAGNGTEAGTIKTNGKMANFPAPGDTPGGADEFGGTSTLVVFDYEENLAAIEELIKQLDTRPQQVLVEATILQTSLNEANALGVDFSIISDASFTDFVGHGGPLSVVSGLLSGRVTPGSTTSPLPADGGGSGIVSGVGNTGGPGGMKIGIVSNDVAVFLRVLDEVTDTTILSNPKILALNRQASRVLVGRKVGYLSTTSTDTATTQTVQFLDTGTQLYFRPTVSNDGMIRMELKPQVSEAVIREQQDATGAAVTIPDEITNEMTTNVMVRDGQTVVLGGLFRESTVSGRKQIPLLGDIPLIGYAFRGQDDTVQRNEIIFMITPHLVNDSTLTQQGERAMDHSDRVRAGAREGVLFFSRDRLTSMLNVKAEEAAARGENGKALWYVRRSLAMNHQQTEAVGLREKLATKKMNWPERSVLERIMDGETANIIRKAQATERLDIATLTAFTTSGSTTSAAFEPVTQSNSFEFYPVQITTAAPHTPTTPRNYVQAFYDAPATPTSFGNVGFFNQFVNAHANRVAQARRESRFTTADEQPETPAHVDAFPVDLNK
ncbi:Type IV pilus biogenesis and competence protein PilQ [Phycisphaerales bacterium]|nr:Type IV pilus biogenesis and competence protein PilQ [Phycisphaerales bacterium]